MDIRQGTIWYDTDEEQYVEVASINAHIPHVDSHASGICVSQEAIRVRVGPFDSYGPLPWSTRDCYIEQFERRYEPTDLTREEAMNLDS